MKFEIGAKSENQVIIYLHSAKDVSTVGVAVLKFLFSENKTLKESGVKQGLP